ncbi:hypothetical protein TEA_020396 [Camellia sinensis var. sinensis]|uniref:Glycine-rich domain-containing protein-like n=1 Tax=Camellia sinensis var. sinensis TaxID=542762 RepID=A0A4S4E1T6_CAMSN|nr:hypothetical protein TEA_020396 [Camellia sinensis var. sinensis]
MEKHQELEWVEAQKIVVSQDLVAAAKQQLQFLAAVDRNRCLYDGPALDSSIHRYKNFWLPLLAKHTESRFLEGPLVVPLDCEWIWHCHRLNPIRYKMDCMELYGRILDSQNVVSSVYGTSKEQTEEIWKIMYPNEPYELNLNLFGSLETVFDSKVEASKSTNYDLVSAVKRQSTFYYQVSRASMNDDLFLEGALARYKGFLHLIKRNKEKKITHFCVPTYDIDLIWHSHQLHPVSYSKDLVAILGKVLEHDDTDSDRAEGKKLNVGFCETTRQWEETFGSRYWRAGAMYRGSTPSTLAMNVQPLNTLSKKAVPNIECRDIIQLPKKKIVEVLLEIVGARNLPSEHAGNLFVSFSKKQPDLFFNTSRRLNILSESREKRVAAFQCEPTGELLLELLSTSPSNVPIAKSTKTLGTTLISLEDLFNPVSKLFEDNWFELVPTSGIAESRLVSLRIALSFTAPVQAPYVLHMVQPQPFSSGSFFPLPERVYCAKGWTHVVDGIGNVVISIQMRIPQKSQEGINGIPKTEVIGMTGSGETRVLAEFIGQGWSLMNSQWFFQLQKTVSKEDPILDLTGSRKVTIFQGRKLGYEFENAERKKNEQDFITIVEFSIEHPYGKAVALLNLKSGFLKKWECSWFGFGRLADRFRPAYMYAVWKKFNPQSPAMRVAVCADKVRGCASNCG